MRAMTTRHVDVQGTRIAFTDVGSGVPVILLHGNPDSRHSWQPVIDQLSDNLDGDVRVIAPEPGVAVS